jgi:hypothetical protein
MDKRLWKLSASFIAAFKSCAFRCYVQYILGIRVIVEADTLRMGTNWHKVLEVADMHIDAPCPSCAADGPDKRCALCSGTLKVIEDQGERIASVLNAAYEIKPASKTVEDWATEKEKIWVASSGYIWRWKDDDSEVIAEEIKFELPLYGPSGRALPGVIVVGMIDKLRRDRKTGLIFIDEHKSTSNPIDSDSSYWAKLNLDTQTLLYVYAARELQKVGALECYGIKATDPLISQARYDVWKKPTIKPKMLTQGESKKFVESGEYMTDKFKITHDDFGEVWVNDAHSEIKPGAKEGTFQIRETAEMYGSRLFQDIVANPENHYARRIIARTDLELERFEQELINIYRTVQFLNKENRWWHNEQQCEATFKCPYISQCYNGVEFDSDNPPDGFKCIYKRKDGDANETD